MSPIMEPPSKPPSTIWSFSRSFVRAGLASAGDRLLLDLPIAQVHRFEIREGSTVQAVVPRDAVRIYAGTPPDA